MRVDNVVKGLVSIGVRHGDRVGVLMDTRPSAFTLVAALSRLGATAVLLRPDGDVAREAGLAGVDLGHLRPRARRAGRAGRRRPCARCSAAAAPSGRDVHVRRPSTWSASTPTTSSCPAWYRPNPHRAGDVAFVLFTGEGAQHQGAADHQPALGAVGAGHGVGRRAQARRHDLQRHAGPPLVGAAHERSAARWPAAPASRWPAADDPDTFWDEVRRYGATHVSYTWTSLAPVVDAPPNRNEQHHPIRMFMGSGMPRNLWRRVTERFPAAKVLEFYASAEGEVDPREPHRPRAGLDGQAAAGHGPGQGRGLRLRRPGDLVLDERGLARECAPDEVGLLLARVEPGRLDGRRAAARRVRERRRLALDRRPVPARRPRRPVAGRPGGRGRRHRRRPGHPVRGALRARPRSRPSTSSSPTASTTAARRCSSPRARCARAPTSAPATSTRRSASCRRCSARATCRWWRRSR